MGNIGKVFQALSDGTRRQILEMLRDGERAAGEIAEQFRMTKPAISHHLSVLKEAGLAVERREGQRIIYALCEDSLLECWDGFLARLCRRQGERRETQKARRARGRDEGKGRSS